MRGFDHNKIEGKWQKIWKETNLYKTQNKVRGKKNYYLLTEFPYPSGNLHIGHWHAFSVPDIYARYRRMKGYNVMYPIGFDAFGLPAENAAIKNKIDPRKWTYENIDRMSEQIESMGTSFDWSRSVITSDPDYYRWTQWLFLQMFKKGLVYRGKALVNWDPTDKTVLANEQVLADGTAERSGAVVEKKELTQWFMRISDYADRLVDDLDGLDWPEEIKESQRNWIGRTEGARIGFAIKGSAEIVEIFTTRADTLFGATYLVLAPEHTAVSSLRQSITNMSEVDDYAKRARDIKEIERIARDREKTGVRLEGITAINPANNEEIPVYVADYVMGHYGSGAIMGVPAHDVRDFEFAKKYHLPIRQVICDLYPDPKCPILDAPFLGHGKLVGSAVYDGLDSEEAKQKITDAVRGVKSRTYKLRDWLISRQRYWGCPIPIVYDPKGKAHIVPEEHLPWKLPGDVDSTPTGEAPLSRSEELKKRTEEIFGERWTPEVDTMDTFVDSSWYFLRYTDSDNGKEFASMKQLKSWMPIDRYSGGAEHTTVHLLYSRFFHKALFDLGLVNVGEPYVERMNRGIILGTDGRKMSKRWRNVVDPDEWVKKVGADSVKMYLAFIGPYNETGSYPWDMGGVIGIRRFLDRVFALKEKVKRSVEYSDEVQVELNRTFRKVGEDIEDFKFNTAISQIMILLKILEKDSHIARDVYENLLRVLAPFAPHLIEELWHKLGHKKSVHLQKWPKYDENTLLSARVSVAIQVAGKTRCVLEVKRGATESEVVKLAIKMPSVGKYLKDDGYKRIVFVRDRVINFIL